MKKRMLVFLLCLLSVPAFAGTHAKKHSLEIAYEHSNYTYREPGLMKLSGPKNGVSVSYLMRSVLSADFNSEDTSFAMLDFRYMDGDTKYDGGYMNWDGTITPYSEGGLDDYYFEAAFKLGKSFELASPLTLYPYFGIGWRQLRNHMDELASGGYQRTQTYLYIPFGAQVEWDIAPVFTLTFKGEADWMVYGNNNSELVGGYSVYDRDSVSFHQSQGYGLRVSAKGQVNLNKIGLFIEPFFRYWHIQNSEEVWFYWGGDPSSPALSMVEPKNNTKEYGIRLGIAF